MILTKTFIAKLNKNINSTIDSLDEEELTKIIKEASNAYYNKGESPISDEIFDIIKDRLIKLNPEYKEIGAPIVGKKELLPCYMGSLDKKIGRASCRERVYVLV